MRKTPGRNWNMARNPEKHEKRKNTHYRTLNMSTKLTIEENEKIMVGTGIWRETWKNVQNEKHTL
jgi:hypothetical protein